MSYIHITVNEDIYTVEVGALGLNEYGITLVTPLLDIEHKTLTATYDGLEVLLDELKLDRITFFDQCTCLGECDRHMCLHLIDMISKEEKEIRSRYHQCLCTIL